MKQLSIVEAKNCISQIFNFIDSGKVVWDDDVFYGHPGLYFFHSKKEFEEQLRQSLVKDVYDRYDIYYITNKLIKYMLGKYDSHTKVKFTEVTHLPIKFLMKEESIYIINLSSELADLIGSSVTAINGVNIREILQQLEDITGYSTIEFLHVSQESALATADILKSLPSLDSHLQTITFQVVKNGKTEEIVFDLTKPLKDDKRSVPENYSYEIVENCIVIHYHYCKDKEKMVHLIETMKVIAKKHKIENYIVDLRDNGGGFSDVVKPLVDYLKDKKVVVLINEKVFSSGRMAFVDLKNIGAYSIGTDISTSLNCFGNVPGELRIDDLDLVVKRSSTYWLYHSDYTCEGYRKDSFSTYFKTRTELLEPIILHPDEYVDLSIEDVLTNNDLQLVAAIAHFSNNGN